MKTVITFLALFICLQITKAQTYVTIPDANFVTWLQANVPSAMVGNQMNILDPAVNTRTTINVYNLGITDLAGVQYFDSLKTLLCTGNQLTNLPFLPNFLTYLDCGFNQLTSLPNLPNSLRTLHCETNQLANLPLLPSSLSGLYCSYNFLTGLPAFPNSIVFLDIRNNQLSNLLNLPNSLQSFNCSNNLLTSLPSIPNGVWEIDCSYNQLLSLPSLPNSLVILNCYHNSISCFPVFPQIQNLQSSFPIVYFNIALNPFTCLPNYIPAMDSVTLNYPLCVTGNTVTNPNGCTFGKGIIGNIFHDLNTDCYKNGSETGVKNVEVNIYDGLNNFVKRTYSDYNGFYFFNDTTGNYYVKIDTTSKPFKVLCANPGIDSLVFLSSSHSLEDSVDFAISCKSGFDVGVQSVYTNGAVFPGTTHALTIAAGDIIKWYNLNCTSSMAGTVSFSVNGPVTYLSPANGALVPNVAGNVYTYTIADFGNINNANDFKLLFTTNSGAQVGDQICVSATITPVNGDNNLSNNIYSYCYNVVNSYDPNIKEVYPITVQPNYTDWLTYTIHFQNTGNTNAINIRLQDVLDAKLNPETFEVLSYSHDNLIDLTGNNLTVRFPNIQLPDSTSNSLGSIGFIQYRIKPKAGWVNDTIRNSANIYFDYNAPVLTNTAKTYFVTTTGISEAVASEGTVNLVPNPTNGLVTITSKYEMQKAEVTNIAGQLLFSQTLNTKEHQMQLQDFAEGIYFVKITYSNGLSIIRKVIKQ